ncbi:unnamed protein product, partial [Lampetra fluviatilis]
SPSGRASESDRCVSTLQQLREFSWRGSEDEVRLGRCWVSLPTLGTLAPALCFASLNVLNNGARQQQEEEEGAHAEDGGAIERVATARVEYSSRWTSFAPCVPKPRANRRCGVMPGGSVGLVPERLDAFVFEVKGVTPGGGRQVQAIGRSASRVDALTSFGGEQTEEEEEAAGTWWRIADPRCRVYGDIRRGALTERACAVEVCPVWGGRRLSVVGHCDVRGAELSARIFCSGKRQQKQPRTSRAVLGWLDRAVAGLGCSVEKECFFLKQLRLIRLALRSLRAAAACAEKRIAPSQERALRVCKSHKYFCPDDDDDGRDNASGVPPALPLGHPWPRPRPQSTRYHQRRQQEAPTETQQQQLTTATVAARMTRGAAAPAVAEVGASVTASVPRFPCGDADADAAADADARMERDTDREVGPGGGWGEARAPSNLAKASEDTARTGPFPSDPSEAVQTRRVEGAVRHRVEREASIGSGSLCCPERKTPMPKILHR